MAGHRRCAGHSAQRFRLAGRTGATAADRAQTGAVAIQHSRLAPARRSAGSPRGAGRCRASARIRSEPCTVAASGAGADRCRAMAPDLHPSPHPDGRLEQLAVARRSVAALQRSHPGPWRRTVSRLHRLAAASGRATESGLLERSVGRAARADPTGPRRHRRRARQRPWRPLPDAGRAAHPGAGSVCPPAESHRQHPGASCVAAVAATLHRSRSGGVRCDRGRAPGGFAGHRAAGRPVHQHPAGDRRAASGPKRWPVAASGAGAKPQPARLRTHAAGGHPALGRAGRGSAVRQHSGVRKLPGRPGAEPGRAGPDIR